MDLRVPTDQEMKEVGERFQPTDKEASYWNNVCERHKQVPKDTYKVAGFLKGILEDVREKFPNSWVLRRVLFEYAKRLERIGTFQMEGADPRLRSDIMVNAADLYQEADEIIGFLSDYGFRQLESCSGAIHFRREAGLEDEIIQLGLAERVKGISEAIFGHRPIYSINRNEAQQLKERMVKTVDDIVQIYVPESD